MSLKFYSDKEDNLREEESINKYKYIFIPYIKNFPSLKEALEQLFLSEGAPQEELNNLTNEILLKCENVIGRNLESIKQKFKNISREEAEIIASYTSQFGDKKMKNIILIKF